MGDQFGRTHVTRSVALLLAAQTHAAPPPPHPSPSLQPTQQQQYQPAPPTLTPLPYLPQEVWEVVCSHLPDDHLTLNTSLPRVNWYLNRIVRQPSIGAPHFPLTFSRVAVPDNGQRQHHRIPHPILSQLCLVYHGAQAISRNDVQVWVRPGEWRLMSNAPVNLRNAAALSPADNSVFLRVHIAGQPHIHQLNGVAGQGVTIEDFVGELCLPVELIRQLQAPHPFFSGRRKRIRSVLVENRRVWSMLLGRFC